VLVRIGAIGMARPPQKRIAAVARRRAAISGAKFA